MKRFLFNFVLLVVCLVTVHTVRNVFTQGDGLKITVVDSRPETVEPMPSAPSGMTVDPGLPHRDEVDWVVDRARREAESEVVRTNRVFMKELPAPVEVVDSRLETMVAPMTNAPSGRPVDPGLLHRDDVDWVVDRARREAESEVVRITRVFMKELLAPVEYDGRTFAKDMLSLMAEARGVCQSKEEYRKYVAKRFEEEMAKRSDLTNVVNIICETFCARLGDIATAAAVEAGRDVEMPTVQFTGYKDFESVFRTNIYQSVDELAQYMGLESKRQAGVYGTANVVSVVAGIMIPVPLLDDIIIGLIVNAMVDVVYDSLVDPDGGMRIEVNKAANEMARRVCYGGGGHPGLQQALEDIAAWHNEVLRKALREAPLVSPGSEREEPFLNDLLKDRRFNGKTEIKLPSGAREDRR